VAEALAGARGGEHFNLIRVEASGNRLVRLHDPGFADDQALALAASWRVDFDAGTVGFRTCADRANPAILASCGVTTLCPEFGDECTVLGIRAGHNGLPFQAT
jgi:hypothetical protein